MYIFKYALKSISRAKGRNILIGIILTVIAISSCVALSIKNAADSVVENEKSSNDIIATLSMDRQNLQKDFKKNSSANNTTSGNNTESPKDFMANIPTLTVDMIKNYGNSNYLKNYYYTAQISMNSSNISKVTNENTNNSNNNAPGNVNTLNNTKSGESDGFKLVGYSSLDAMSEFVNGTYKISNGSMFDISATDSPCVISNELADKNSLSVGSTILLTDLNDSTKAYNLKVVGIYTDSSENSDDKFSMFSMAANQILVPSSIVENIANNDSNIKIQVTPEFVLNSGDNIDEFKSELTSKGLSNYYTVLTNKDSVESTVKPIENLSSYTSIFLIIVLIIGAIILFILNMINIKDRKYEIGVLRAIGMKKHLVLSQFLIESMIITLISLIIGISAGSIISVPTANYMLKNEIASQQSSQENVSQNFGGKSGTQMNRMQQRGGNIISKFGKNSNTNYVDKINAVVNVKVVLELAGIGILLTLISDSVSMIYIAKYSPLKILSSRT